MSCVTLHMPHFKWFMSHVEQFFSSSDKLLELVWGGSVIAWACLVVNKPAAKAAGADSSR